MKQKKNRVVSGWLLERERVSERKIPTCKGTKAPVYAVLIRHERTTSFPSETDARRKIDPRSAKRATARRFSAENAGMKIDGFRETIRLFTGRMNDFLSFSLSFSSHSLSRRTDQRSNATAPRLAG